MKITGAHVIPDGVTQIPKKEYLSQKSMLSVELPDSVSQIGDWAFAYCSSLREISLPRREISFGKSVFLDCHALQKVTLRDLSETAQVPSGAISPFSSAIYSCPRLLAAIATDPAASYLLDLPAVGTREWLQMWDARMVQIINTPDDDGFQKQILCGEEDYGSTDLDTYMSSRRMEKVRLLMTRLLEDSYLEDSLRAQCITYLTAHTKKETATSAHPSAHRQEETWDVCLKEHSADREWYELFVKIGCLTEGNRDAILQDMNQIDPAILGNVLEMKSFFLQQFSDTSFFDSLEL